MSLIIITKPFSTVPGTKIMGDKVRHTGLLGVCIAKWENGEITKGIFAEGNPINEGGNNFILFLESPDSTPEQLVNAARIAHGYATEMSPGVLQIALQIANSAIPCDDPFFNKKSLTKYLNHGVTVEQIRDDIKTMLYTLEVQHVRAVLAQHGL